MSRENKHSTGIPLLFSHLPVHSYPSPPIPTTNPLSLSLSSHTEHWTCSTILHRNKHTTLLVQMDLLLSRFPLLKPVRRRKGRQILRTQGRLLRRCWCVDGSRGLVAVVILGLIFGAALSSRLRKPANQDCETHLAGTGVGNKQGGFCGP